MKLYLPLATSYAFNKASDYYLGIKIYEDGSYEEIQMAPVV